MSHVGRGLRDAFGESLVEIGHAFKDVIVIDADVANPTRAHHFWERFPERFVELGVAESNAISFAAGIAASGLIPVVNMFACFASQRVCDQVSISVAYPKLNVKICGCYAGLTTPNTGATHQAINDIAIMMSLPNMAVIEPADEIELKNALLWAIRYEGPVYFRVVRCELPRIFSERDEFHFGKGILLRDGKDVTLIGSGLMTSRCIEAREKLKTKGISAKVISISSLKPIDEELIVQSAKETGCMVTAENHSIIGGLGSAVSDVLTKSLPVPLEKVGIKDRYGESGKLDELLEKFGLTSDKIAEAARIAVERR